jgi:hypothetical protein
LFFIFVFGFMDKLLSVGEAAEDDAVRSHPVCGGMRLMILYRKKDGLSTCRAGFVSVEPVSAAFHFFPESGGFAGALSGICAEHIPVMRGGIHGGHFAAVRTGAEEGAYSAFL